MMIILIKILLIVNIDFICSSIYIDRRTLVIYCEYVTFGNELSSKLIKLNKGSIAIISYICNNIKWCSNKITFTESDITNYAHIDSKTFYIALTELYNEQIIINTTKKSTYVVNHNYIFRGSITDFIKIYHDKYDGLVGFLDDKKRIILDD